MARYLSRLALSLEAELDVKKHLVLQIRTMSILLLAGRSRPLPRTGLCYKLLKDRVRLSSHDANSSGHERRHTSDAHRAGLGPVAIDRVAERTGLQYLSRFIHGKTALPDDVQQYINVADVLVGRLAPFQL